LGVVSFMEALRMAGELDVDLVEIAATANPPVCRLMDYGKFKYQEQKKAAEAKAKQTVIEIKEVKFRPGTDDGDYNIKMRNIRRFLADGDKCKITLRFRGREITHQEIGMACSTASATSWPTPSGRAVSQAGRPPDDHDDRAGRKKPAAAKPAAEAAPAGLALRPDVNL
jgi:translation initiation factor IF-3